MAKKKEKTLVDPLVAAKLKRLNDTWRQVVSSEFTTITEVIVEKYCDMKPERMEWLWDNVIPKEGITLFVGDPGVRKSFTTLYVAARVSQGECLPNCKTPTERGSVLIISSEDSHTNTVLPRLMATKADLTKIGHVVSVRDTTFSRKHPKKKEEESYVSSLLGVIDVLEKKIKEIPDFKLLIVDTLSSYLGDKRMNAMEDMRSFLDRLSTSCYMYHYAAVLVNHFNKNEEGSAQYRSAGSVGIRGAARAQWGFVLDPQDKERTLMLEDKVTNGKGQLGFAFRIQEAELNIENKPEWTGCCDFEDKVIHEDLAAFLSKQQKKQSPKKNQAAEWLKEYLKDGQPHESNTVIAAADQCGISEKTLRRAMGGAGIKTNAVKDVKTNKIDYWTWQMANTP